MFHGSGLMTAIKDTYSGTLKYLSFSEAFQKEIPVNDSKL